MALVNKTFSDIITFTRASTATYFNSAGVLQSAAIDMPRFDYDPVTLAARGLLIEESRTNSLTYSEDFSNAAWTKTNVTVTTDATTAPSGTTTADQVFETVTNAAHAVSFPGVSFTSGTSYTLSIFAKEPSNPDKRYLALILPSAAFTSNLVGIFDLATGTVTTVSASTTAAVVSVGNGWYRISISAQATVTTTGSVQYRLTNSSTSGLTAYAGNTAVSFFLWGAQLEAGAFATSYIPTTTTALTRSADVASVNTLSPWYNATEGTLFAEATNPIASIYRVIAEAGTASDFRDFTLAFDGLRTDFANRTQAFTGNDVLGPAASLTAGSTVKVAGAYTASVTRQAYNGLVASITANVAQKAAADRVWFGSRTGSTIFLNGYLRRITYYPRALSTAELQAITA